ncbi:hypothetical protein BD311DRAFT_113949 [Dichomitus squalens]|uniref:Uncharacterized protein n=1 Tax=Dichomitus squalens TaxID=114155 RepID=A0A4Q9MAA7_9APHY|nr:hypothetical protein BD311DRAFT_113949 [Dichomitus squalens]
MPPCRYTRVCACLCAVHAFLFRFRVCILLASVVVGIFYVTYFSTSGGFVLQSLGSPGCRPGASSSPSVGLCSGCTRTLSFLRRARWLPDMPTFCFVDRACSSELFISSYLESRLFLWSPSRSYISSSQLICNICMLYAIAGRT